MKTQTKTKNDGCYFYSDFIIFFSITNYSPYASLPPGITTLLPMTVSLFPFAQSLHPLTPHLHPQLPVICSASMSLFLFGLFCLFIRFHKRVKSYGICLSYTGHFLMKLLLSSSPLELYVVMTFTAFCSYSLVPK